MRRAALREFDIPVLYALDSLDGFNEHSEEHWGSHLTVLYYVYPSKGMFPTSHCPHGSGNRPVFPTMLADPFFGINEMEPPL